jgi:hypothetical protein
MLPRTVLYYGKDEPLPERIELHAGPVSLFYEQGDLRYVRWGDQEILRRVYVAIRDSNWRTIPNRLSGVSIENAEDSFRITYQVENRLGDIDFAWKAEITGSPDGVIRFLMDGQARATFLRNRIGFCVLHPAACAGKACRVGHTDGTQDQTIFPLDISADQPVRPFDDMRSIDYEVQPGVRARTDLDGDVFEMEDQRNWTDASFKTYCTPLSLPFPAVVEKGAHICQTVSLSIRDERPDRDTPRPTARSGSSAVHIDLLPSEQPLPLPQIGLGVASHGQPLSDLEVARLKDLHLHHLRVDLQLSDPAYPTRLVLAAKQARQLGVGLAVAVFISAGAEDELIGLRKVLGEVKPPVTAWLVYPARESYAGGSPTDAVVRAAHTHLAGYDPSAQFAAGTNTDFIFLKRNPPSPESLDMVCLAINPQPHAFDNASLIETLEMQSVVVASAGRIAKGLPVIVSPVTLKPRFNPYATGPAPQVPPGEIPAEVDARQMSLFCAGWTACSVRYIAEAGARWVTYYETTGWRGVMETAAGSPEPHLFRSLAGAVFPVYLVLADIGEFVRGQVIALRSSDPLRVNGLVLRSGRRAQVILSNLTPAPQHLLIHVPTIPAVAQPGRQVRVGIRSMDETNVLEAIQDPTAFRARPFEQIHPSGDTLEIDLRPYAVTRVEL